MGDVLLQLEHVRKAFAGSLVLEDVDFDLRGGEVHVLAGENGAGKSTLIKIMTGVYADFCGTFRLHGRAVRFRAPRDAYRHGIAAIFQELSLVPSMSVLDNLFLGRRVARRRQAAMAEKLCARLALDLDLHRAIEDYPIAMQQLIEVAKALAADARILIMDEPTSALNDHEARRLFEIMADLRQQGCGIIFISHRMDEMYRVADRITVLRDGRKIGTAPASELSREQLVQWMIGRRLAGQFPPRAARLGAERLTVSRLPLGRGTGGVSFAIRQGEILGVAGLQGAGISELMHGLFGARPGRRGGQLTLDGSPLRVRGPREAIRAGLALLTNDRKTTGLVASLDAGRNITVASLPAFSPGGWLRTRAEDVAAAGHVQTLSIAVRSLRQAVMALSGGNQQKVLLARWLETKPRVLLLDEPTRGVDVGAKHEIYLLMHQWTGQGMSILLATSEMEELLALSDRIMVLYEGAVAATFERSQFSQQAILRAAMGMEPS